MSEKELRIIVTDFILKWYENEPDNMRHECVLTLYDNILMGLKENE